MNEYTCQHADWRFEWLTSWDEVWDPAFVTQWQSWMDRSPDAHVFFEPCLVRAWYETYVELRDIEPRFLVARRGPGCTVFFPLVLDRCGWKDGWLRVLRPVGWNEFDYHDPVCASSGSGGVWAGFWQGLLRELERACGRFDVFSLPRLREGCVAEFDGFAETNRAPFIDLAGAASFDDLLSNVHSRLRQDIRRQRRRLAKLGPLVLGVLGNDDIVSARDVLGGFLKAHQARWPRAYRAAGFYERLARHGSPLGPVHLSVLECGEKAIGWHVGFLHKRRFYYYVPVFDTSMASYSPGKVHLAKLLEEALRLKVEVFDLLTGREAYKLHWTKTSIGLYEHRRRMPGLGPRLRSGLRALLRGGAGLLGR